MKHDKTTEFGPCDRGEYEREIGLVEVHQGTGSELGHLSDRIAFWL